MVLVVFRAVAAVSRVAARGRCCLRCKCSGICHTRNTKVCPTSNLAIVRWRQAERECDLEVDGRMVLDLVLWRGLTTNVKVMLVVFGRARWFVVVVVKKLRKRGTERVCVRCAEGGGEAKEGGETKRKLCTNQKSEQNTKIIMD